MFADYQGNTDLQIVNGYLGHFLTLDRLPMSYLTSIFELADSFLNVSDRTIKKVPILRGKTIANLFFENSTRTRTTFDLAAKRLSADVLSMDIRTSSTAKGETLLDTLQNLEAMSVDMFVVRHNAGGAAHFIAQSVSPGIAVVNAGDGQHSHPTQAMLDMYTIRHFKKEFTGLKVAIVGDIVHSRVARAQIHALHTLGVRDLRLIGPQTLLPKAGHLWPAKLYNNLDEGIADCDVVILLRLQRERMTAGLIPNEHEYFHCYGMTKERLRHAKPDAIVMHPGPINRGVEIDSRVADGKQSVILDQVHFGIAVRMALLATVIDGQTKGRRIG